VTEIKDNVEADSINAERYLEELAITMIERTKATGRMIEQEPITMIIMVTAIHSGGSGGKGGVGFTARGIMEHKVLIGWFRVISPYSVSGIKGLSLHLARLKVHMGISFSTSSRRPTWARSSARLWWG
jgi:hypothetical protein